MGIYAVKPLFQKLLSPVKSLLVLNKIHPFWINLGGLFFSLCMALVFWLSQTNLSWLYLVPILSFARTASNALDGLVARELKVGNQAFGEVLNEFIDRVSDSAIFITIGLLVYTNLLLVFATLILILLNSYLSILSKAAGGSRQYGGIMGKADRMIVLGIAGPSAALFQQPLIINFSISLILIGTFITLIQRFRKTYFELYV